MSRDAAAARSGGGGLSNTLVPAPDGLRSPAQTTGFLPKGIAMNEYEVICKGVVIIGSLQQDASAVRS